MFHGDFFASARCAATRRVRCRVQCLVGWGCLWLLLVGSARAQDEPGLEFLDQAMQKKLAAQRMSDLDEVVALCEKGLEAGLREEDQLFAKQLMTSTLYERADRLVQSLAEGGMTLAWEQRRQQALKSLEKGVEVLPDDGPSHLLLAEVHQLPGGDAEKGRAAAEKAITLFADNPPRRAEAYVARAAYLDDADKRLEDYAAALRDDPLNLEARKERGRVTRNENSRSVKCVTWVTNWASGWIGSARAAGSDFSCSFIRFPFPSGARPSPSRRSTG